LQLTYEVPAKIPHFHAGKAKITKDMLLFHQLNLQMPKVTTLPMRYTYLASIIQQIVYLAVAGIKERQMS